MTEGVNNNIDLQQQVQSGEISIEDIKKLFEKIPKKYLDDLSIDGDKDFDNEDIQKIISGNFDKNSPFGKELLAKGNKISIEFLKQVIEKVDKRIKIREYEDNKGKTLKNASVKAFNIDKNNLIKLKEKNLKHNHFNFDIGKDGKGKEIKDKAEFIELRIQNKNEKINQIIDNLEKNQGLIYQINFEIAIINSYLDFLSNEDSTKIDKEYESLYKELKNRIQKLRKKVNDLHKEVSKANQEAEKIIYLEKEYSKLIKKFNKIINNKNFQNNDDNNSIKKLLGETKKKLTKKVKSLTQNIKSGISETFKGIDEFFHIKKSIKNKASMFPNDRRVKAFLIQAENINNNKEINPIAKINALKNISKNLGEHIRNLILNKSKSIYDKYNKYFPKHEGIDELYKVIQKQSKAIEDNGGISYAELEILQSLNDYFLRLSPIIKEVENTLKGIPYEQKETLIKEARYYLEEIINNFNNNKNVDLSDFKEFIKKKINETPILEKIKNKEASEMNSKEAKVALEYTNKHYKELDDRMVTSTSYTLETIDDFDEIHNFQEELIKKILESNGGKKEGGIGFDKDGNLWGFDSQKGNYLINIGDFIKKLNEGGIEKINSKAFASFLAYLDSVKSLTGPILYDLLGPKEFEKLQKLWKKNDNSIAKNLLKKVNLEDTIKMIKSFDIKKYNEKLKQLKNSNNPQEDLKRILKNINNKIINASDEERKRIYKRLWGIYGTGLSFEIGKDGTKFDIIDFKKVSSDLNLDPKFKKLIKDRIEKQIKIDRKKRIEEKINKIKGKVLGMFEKRFGNTPEFQNLKALISIDKITDKTTGKIDKAKVNLMRKSIINFIEQYNEKNPDKKVNIPYEFINEISLNFINLAKLNIIENMKEIDSSLDKILNEIEELQKGIKDLEKELKEFEEKIKKLEEKIKKEAAKAKLNIEDFLKTPEGIKIAKELKQLKEGKKGIIEGIAYINKILKKRQTQRENLSETAITLSQEKVELEIERRFIEEANSIGMTATEFKKTPKGKKILKDIRKKVEAENKEEIDNYRIIASGNIKEAKKALEKNQTKNEKILNELENTLFNNEKQSEKTKKQATSFTEKTDIIQENYNINIETGIISITENGKEEKIILTPKEQQLIKNNPETAKNIINFYETLNKLGLKKLWSIKENIFKSIENVIGIGFKIDKDYLNENEIKIFLNAILKSIGEKEIPTIFNLNSFLSQIETINKTQFGGGEKIENTYYGETYLENKFFEKFVGRNNTIIGFKQSEFEKAIK